MNPKKTDLDEVTVSVVRKILAMPPKPHDEMKIGQQKKKRKRGPKDRASSAKRRTA